jgi:hypothetical protein
VVANREDVVDEGKTSLELGGGQARILQAPPDPLPSKRIKEQIIHLRTKAQIYGIREQKRRVEQGTIDKNGPSGKTHETSQYIMIVHMYVCTYIL